MQRKQQTTFKQHHSCVTQQEGPAAALEPFSPTEDLLPARRALKHHTTFSFLFSSSEGIHLLRYSPHPCAVSLQKHSFTEAGGNLTAEEQELAERSVQRCLQSTRLLGSNGFFPDDYKPALSLHSLLKNNGNVPINYTAAAMLFGVSKIQGNKTKLFDIRALTPSIREAPVTLQIFSVPILFILS